MARIIFGMNVSLDGYVDHDAPGIVPDAVLFRHFTDRVAAVSDGVYGRVVYGLMQYWDEDKPEWGPAEHDFAQAWRGQHKWVVSRTLKAVGPNATLVTDGPEAIVRRLKAEKDGEVEVSGPTLVGALTKLGLVDEYWLYLHPIVTGGGKPFFTEARPPLRLTTSERIGDAVIRLIYVPA